MNLIIYKGIEHEQLGDAPFIGARISAAQCSGSCKGCFNQHIKDYDNQYATAQTIIDQVLQNPLNEGIILGGLEWTEQPYDMVQLISLAVASGLQVMLYTRLTEEQFIEQFPLFEKSPIWCKFGEYDETKAVTNYISHGVPLATSNQYIKYMKKRR